MGVACVCVCRPLYGTLPEFFKKHKAHFHVTADQKVFLKAEYDAIKGMSDPFALCVLVWFCLLCLFAFAANENPLGESKKKKGAAAPAAGTGGEKKTKVAVAHKEAKSESGSAGTVLAVLLLAAVRVCV
jgi:hypothetical protein